MSLRAVFVSALVLTFGAPVFAGSPNFLGRWQVLEAEQNGDYYTGRTRGYRSVQDGRYAQKVLSSLVVKEARDDEHDFFLSWTVQGDVTETWETGNGGRESHSRGQLRFDAFFLCSEEALPSQGGLIIRCTGDNIQASFSLALFSENTGVLVMEKGSFGDKKEMGVDFPVGTPLFVSRASGAPSGQIAVATTGGNTDFVGTWSELVTKGQPLNVLTAEASFRKDFSHVIVWKEPFAVVRYLACTHVKSGETGGQSLKMGTISCRPFFPLLKQQRVKELDDKGQVVFALRSEDIAVFANRYYAKKQGGVR